MIPKIIHYCWFGKKIPESALKVVESWKKHLPDFDFYLWGNEHLDEYDINFVKQAQRKNHYAFVADYFRLRKVYEYGGFYLDTDMILVKPLDSLLWADFVICSEIEGRPAWGLFGSKKNNYYLKECYESYHKIEYDQFKPPVIPYFLRDITLNYISQEPKNRLNLDPEYFYPLPMDENPQKWQDYIFSETIGVHLWDFSWGKLKTAKPVSLEVLHRLKVLLGDFFTFTYTLHYFRINLVRIGRLINVR